MPSQPEAPISVAIPTIPPRVKGGLLDRAVRSVTAQTLTPAGGVHVALDGERLGAGHTRQRALDLVETGWVAFLDDDDHLKPGHLRRLYDCAQDTGADYVYSWFDVIGGTDPFPQHFGRPFDPADPVQTTITVLVRTDLAKQVGFLHPPGGDTVGGLVWGEDYQFTLGCLRAGARIVHLPERTWYWHHDTPGGNTSGRPDRW